MVPLPTKKNDHKDYLNAHQQRRILDISFNRRAALAYMSKRTERINSCAVRQCSVDISRAVVHLP